MNQISDVIIVTILCATLGSKIRVEIWNKTNPSIDLHKILPLTTKDP